jgi:ATP diphosphatase
MPPESDLAPYTSPLEQLLGIMARLRDPERGCPWDVAQDFRSVAPYTIEEAYEVADACERGDLDSLKDELGDLLLQVVFHARMAEECGAFGFDQVESAIVDKMERRHRHIFGDGSGSPDGWETIKAAERESQGDGGSALAGVAAALPALMRAEKLSRRAARVGFDWPDSAGIRAKILEELAEVDAAAEGAEQEEELGDLLFAVANWARKLGHDPELALRRANAKFERRFRAMEERAGTHFPALSLADKEALWQAVKQAGG